jgi:hypothetical protein
MPRRRRRRLPLLDFAFMCIVNTVNFDTFVSRVAGAFGVPGCRKDDVRGWQVRSSETFVMLALHFNNNN